MRAAITSLPPLFPQLHGALHLSPAGQAVLAAIRKHSARQAEEHSR